jgi:hypothetical protein
MFAGFKLTGAPRKAPTPSVQPTGTLAEGVQGG